MPRDVAAREASAPVWAAWDAMSAQVLVKTRASLRASSGAMTAG